MIFFFMELFQILCFCFSQAEKWVKKACVLLGPTESLYLLLFTSSFVLISYSNEAVFVSLCLFIMVLPCLSLGFFFSGYFPRSVSCCHVEFFIRLLYVFVLFFFFFIIFLCVHDIAFSSLLIILVH
ncbi:hypothetical protein CDL12_11028 [Handroanthus impetiginosus]|uniref:Uncharacterized protein n=1 Tax=Handroanthus impetiginosus TaxID=429701 RepID=A0A2G9HFL7_9LAMI|nr:hypothetical protein CDL12_11028 [Handroanthus impetiginosus]